MLEVERGNTRLHSVDYSLKEIMACHTTALWACHTTA
jgi:hypothetical protein